MSSDRTLRLNKLSEVLHLVGDPLLEKLDKSFEVDPRILQYSTQSPLELKKLIDSGLNGKLEDLLMRAVENTLYNPQKRSNTDQQQTGPSQKKKKFDGPSQRFSSIKLPQKSTVTSLKPQREVSQEELDEFLSRDISELEILSVPEHYPTKPHTVSSLAELYYLTQTLPLIKLLPGSHKALMTENFELALLEGKIAVLYSRIEELKRQGKWSLRQPQRFYDPFTYAKKTKKFTFSWDNLLDEARWMATDFKELSKFKKSCSVVMAHAVKDYWKYGSSVCVKRKPIVHITEEEVAKANSKADEPLQVETPDPSQPVETIDVSLLVKHDDEKGADEEKDEDEIMSDILSQGPILASTTVASAMAAAASFHIKTPSSDKSPFKLYIDINELKKIDQSIIKNLPKFTPFDEDIPATTNQGSLSPAPVSVPTPALRSTDNSMIPVSRLLHPFNDDDEWHKIVLKESSKVKSSKKGGGPPEYQKGLFGFQSRRRFSYLKPPKPPLIKNIDYRSPTIWLPQDDKYLIHYVAEFSFNWDLISEHLSSFASSLKKYKSNIERRTPWQCFERYIQLNEKFQFSDMKGVYAYHAQKWLEHAHKAQSTTKRRISPLGVGTESIQRGHRRLRWASLFDAMRKCMKKREIASAKVSNRRIIDSNGGTIVGSSTASATAATSSTTGSASGTSGAPAIPGNTSTTDSPSEGASAPSSSAIAAGVASSSSDAAGSNAASPNQPNSSTGVKRTIDRIPTPAELSKLKFERDKSIQEAYMNQQATRSRMIAAVAQQQKQIGANRANQPGAAPASNSSNAPNVSVNSSANLSADTSGIASPNVTNAVTSSVNANLQRVSAGQSIANAKPGSPQISQVQQQLQLPQKQQQQLQQQKQLQLQQQLLQQQQKQQSGGSSSIGGQIHSKVPTTPNGTPYTPEQLQQLILKQRRMMQQSNPQLNMATQVKSPSLLQNVPMNKLSPQQQQQQHQLMQGHSHKVGNLSQGSPVQSQNVSQQNPIQSPISQQNQSQTIHSQAISHASAPKPRIQFAPAQVSAIINSIQQKNPSFTKDQVTKLAAQYLANLQQQQQNRYNQQQAQGQTTQQQQVQQQQQRQLQQQQMQQRIGQQHLPQGASGQFRQQVPSLAHKLSPQISSLTPQERNQLQMLKAAKSAQQQQLQQHQQQKLQQQQHQHLQQQSPQLHQMQQMKVGSSPVSMPLDMQNMSKLEFEQRKKAILQKQQQLQQQQQIQQQQLQSQQNLGQGNISRAPSSTSSSGSPPRNMGSS